jgi:kynurenine formamidase
MRAIRVPPEPSELAWLPIKIAGSDGAPARAFVRSGEGYG